jgi:disulfide bond formation protein DsbB
MTDVVILALSLLVVAVQATLGLFVLLVLASLVLEPARRALLALRRAIAGTELALAAVVAVVATAGSLYFSEVAGFLACPLCWWQRIFMYPLAVILTIAVLDRGRSLFSTRRLVAYVGALPVLGAAVAVYHLYVEHVPGAESVLCRAGVPCSVRWFTELGYITIPMMALTGFAAIGALLALAFVRPGAQAPGSHPGR